MEVYLVGGAVRDSLMGAEPKDEDYVVVGSNPEQMLSLGFKQVGADFPVFLHPETGDEYALARRETKVGEGYNGFTSEWEDVTVGEDLSRRDLTINSIASSGFYQEYIDPFNGVDDINNKVLRHTTAAFAEDPVRVLRIARFLARFGDEWTVAPETYALCQKLAWSEFGNLTAERVFLEMEKALNEPSPWLFFEFLYMLDYDWFTEVFAMVGVPQPVTHHPENDTFKHVMLCLKQGVSKGASAQELFAILCHDLGKPVCWKEQGNLHGHEGVGVPYVKQLCDRLKVPNDYRDLAMKVCEHHQRSHKAKVMKATSVHNLLADLGCFRKPELLLSFNLCNWADATGRTGLEDKVYNQGDYLVECLAAANSVSAKHVINQSKDKELTGAKLGNRIRQFQIAAIKEVKEKWKNNKNH
jgi:tRNA nucleotidyltransferase (CCA-adding enzyme)